MLSGRAGRHDVLPFCPFAPTMNGFREVSLSFSRRCCRGGQGQSEDVWSTRSSRRATASRVHACCPPHSPPALPPTMSASEGKSSVPSQNDVCVVAGGLAAVAMVFLPVVCVCVCVCRASAPRTHSPHTHPAPHTATTTTNHNSNTHHTRRARLHRFIAGRTLALALAVVYALRFPYQQRVGIRLGNNDSSVTCTGSPSVSGQSDDNDDGVLHHASHAMAHAIVVLFVLLFQARQEPRRTGPWRWSHARMPAASQTHTHTHTHTTFQTLSCDCAAQPRPRRACVPVRHAAARESTKEDPP